MGLEARLIGRDEELAVLKQTLHRVESEGRPALVTIVGPAGVGKSRLTHELLDARRGPSRLRLLAHGPVSRVRQHLVFGARRRDQGAVRDPRGRLRRRSRRPRPTARSRSCSATTMWPRRSARSSPAIRPARSPRGALRGVATVPRTDGRALSARPRARGHPLGRRRAARLHRPRGGLGPGPDPPAHDSRGPSCSTMRPTWGGGKRNAASIYLDPLTDDEAVAMVDDLLPGAITDGAPPAHRRAERGQSPLHGGDRPHADRRRGAARDRGLEVGGRQTRRRGRAAALDPGPHRGPARRPARRREGASCRTRPWSGGSSGPGRCRELTGRDLAEVRDALGRLRVKELVVPQEPSSFSGEDEFAFRHNLIRDGAYDSLPKSLRAEKHAVSRAGPPSAPATGPTRSPSCSRPTTSRRSGTSTSSGNDGRRWCAKRSNARGLPLGGLRP